MPIYLDTETGQEIAVIDDNDVSVATLHHRLEAITRQLYGQDNFTVQPIKEKKMSTQTPSPTPENTEVSDDFIKSYFDSDEWVKRLHANLAICLYNNHRFGLSAAERRTRMSDRDSLTSINKADIYVVATSSKYFSKKKYNVVLFNACVDEFMAKNDFVKFSAPTDTVPNPYNDQLFYNKFLLAKTVVKVSKTNGVKEFHYETMPLENITVCPCCAQVVPSRSCTPSNKRGRSLTVSGMNRLIGSHNLHSVYMQGADGPLALTLGDYASRYACYDCSNEPEVQWGQCRHCSGFDHQAHLTQSEEIGNGGFYCPQCLEAVIQDSLFVNNYLTFQPNSVEISNKLRYVGCEFECYVAPKKIPKFDRKFVFQVKHDGSLVTQGKGVPVEVVTQPLLDWREDAINKICKELKEVNVYVDNTCGGHIHVDSTGINLSRSSMKKVRNIFRIYEAAFFAVSGRNRLANGRYCAPVPTDDTDPLDSRYVSLNLCSVNQHNTIEFRMFDGSADPEEWLSRIAFAEGFVNFAKDGLNQIVDTSETAVLDSLSRDIGFQNYREVLNSYASGRVQILQDTVIKNGRAIINLAASRFKIKPKVIESLISQYEKNWVNV